MKALARLSANVVVALLLLALSLGEALPLWAQQPSPFHGNSQTLSHPGAQPLPQIAPDVGVDVAPKAFSQKPEPRVSPPSATQAPGAPAHRTCVGTVTVPVRQPEPLPPSRVQGGLTAVAAPTQGRAGAPSVPGQLPAEGAATSVIVGPPAGVEEPSAIERAFADLGRSKTSSEIRQFGYSVFSTPVSTFAPVDDVPVGPDYILGPGDDLVVNVSGAMDSALVRTVDRNGRIFLPKVGPVRVWGLNFSQADRLVRDELGRYFRGFQTTVTLGRLRTIRVYIVGEVCQPGSYTISSLSTLTNGLFAAGGPTKLGSLREIRLLRNNHLIGALDLYDFLLKGDRTRDFRLESGDTIFVPTVGHVVGIEGEVKRPAIYEVRDPVRASDLILMAGGVTPRSYLKRVQVVRQNPSAERTAIDLDLTRVFTDGDRAADLALQNGDLVRIFPSDYRVYNVVNLVGAVKYPGDYELKSGMRVSQLLTRETVLPEAHLERVEIVRRRPDLSPEIVAVDLKQAWAGVPTHDLLLVPLDEIKVGTALRPVGMVTLEGEVKRPGQYSIAKGERLSSVIRRAGGFTDRAHLKGAVYTRVSLKAIEQEQLNAFVKAQEARFLAVAGTSVVGGDKDETGQAQQVLQARRDLLKTLASRVAVGRMVVRLDEPDKLEKTADDVVLEDGDSLRISEPPASVLVIGSVRTSTSVQYREGMGVDYYVGRVGGFTKEADRKEVHIVRADGSAVSGFASIRDLEPGDAIIVPLKEEEKIRVLPTFRDVVTIMGQTLISIAALALLF